MSTISVCICTYKRPELLNKCIESVINYAFETIDEIIVVDNDPGGSAHEIVNELASKYNKPIKYFHEPVPNIAIARNRCIREAMGYWVAFIDDDEYAESNWLKELLISATETNADAVWGPVIYSYQSNTPKYISNVIKGDRINQDGFIRNNLSTGNVLVKRSILLSIEGPFNQSYGSSGGEDSALFHYLQNRGAKYWTNSKGILYEIQGKERSKTAWHFERSYRSGWTRSKIYLNSHNIFYAIFMVHLFSLLGLSKAFIKGVANILNPKEGLFIFFLGVVYQVGRIHGLYKEKYKFYGQ